MLFAVNNHTISNTSVHVQSKDSTNATFRSRFPPKRLYTFFTLLHSNNNTSRTVPFTELFTATSPALGSNIPFTDRAWSHATTDQTVEYLTSGTSMLCAMNKTRALITDALFCLQSSEDTRTMQAK